MASDLSRRALEFGAKIAPGRLAALLDRLRPDLAQGFGGAFNGQKARAAAVEELFDLVPFRTVIETGTYRGTTTEFLSRLGGLPTATIETSSRYFHYAKARLRTHPTVTVMRGDSAKLLDELATTEPWSRSPAFFYLDAHWGPELPLQAELAAIGRGWEAFAIVIDDFKVEGDPGYAFDDYGPGAALELSILAPISTGSTVAFWPAAPSLEESGARRGWILVASAGQVAQALAEASHIESAGPLDVLIEAHSTRSIRSHSLRSS